MKRLVVLIGCCVFLLAVVGCGRQNERMSNQPELADQTRQEALRGLWQGETYEQPLPDFFGDQRQRSALPDFLVGVWQVKTGQYKDKWGFKFEPDGSILRIIYAAEGPVYLAEGESYGDAKSEDAYYFSTMGPCEARYRPETRMLKVKIVMDHMIKLSIGELEGRIEDYFEGPVSEDGKIWKADWLNYGWLKDAAPPTFDVIEAHPIPLVFTKTDQTQIKQKDNEQ